MFKRFRRKKTRENFNETNDKTETLMKKMMELRSSPPNKSDFTRVGYLFLMEKKAFGTTWTKQYCRYSKSSKEFEMQTYNQLTGKVTGVDKMTLSSCVRRMSESIEKRFCFDIMAEKRPGVIYTLQALSEDDRKAWMDAMDGKEPTYAIQGKVSKSDDTTNMLDESGFAFVNRCIEVLESRGMEEQGLYRVTGVASKVSKLLDRRKSESSSALSSLDDSMEWESKTITSGLKTYLRNLKEPIMTYRYHNGFIAAAKQESRDQRINDVHTLVHRIPPENFEMLKIVIKHLTNVTAKCDKNLMTTSNLAVCFGPTLLRPEEETVASIMDIKFYNVVVEILIDNYDLIFTTSPDELEKQPQEFSACNDSPGAIKNSPPEIALSSNSSEPSSVGVQRNSLPYGSHYRNSHAITHAVIRSYDIEPMSSSLHNVASSNDVSRSNGISHFMSCSDHTSRQDLGSRPDHATNHRLVNAHRLSSGSVAAYSEGNLHNMQSYSPKTKYRPYTGLGNERADILNSTSSSNDSISSTSSRDHVIKRSTYGNSAFYTAAASPQKSKRGTVPLSVPYATGYHSPKTVNSSMETASTSGRSSPHSSFPKGVRRVRTLYACLGENDGELSFEPNQIITNVKRSLEPGWLEGTLNGKTGLVPENYVEILP